MDVGVERPRRKDINSPYSAVEKNKWSCTSTPHVPCGVHKKILTLPFLVCWGRTVTEAVGRRPFNAEAGLKFQDSVCVCVCVCVCVREREILWLANSQWDRFSPITSLSPCQPYSTSHLHTRVHHLQYTCRALAVDNVVKPTLIKPIRLYTHRNGCIMVYNRWSFVFFTTRICVQFWNNCRYNWHTAL